MEIFEAKKHKIQRGIETTSGYRGAIGEHGTYEWQTVAYAECFAEAQDKVSLMDSSFTYRLKYTEDLIVLLHEGDYRWG